MKIAVVDPRCSKTAARAWKWLPIAPNGVGALALAMIHWIIEQRTLQCRLPGQRQQGRRRRPTRSPPGPQAAWLVKIGEDGKPGTFLRGSDIGLPRKNAQEAQGRRETQEGEKPEQWEFDPFIVLSEGQTQTL